MPANATSTKHTVPPVVVIDIEGTVCPISFVKDTLFPYFLDQVPAKLKGLTYPIEKAAAAPDASASELARIAHVVSGFSTDITASYESLLSHITQLVKNDIKDPVLKSLQGLIWQIGYVSGDLQAPVYADAIAAIESIGRDSKRDIYVYSSGSVKAQKLLFGYVKPPANDSSAKQIDLNANFAGYFDITTSGHKQEASSYSNILKDIGRTDWADSVLFLSDNVKEVEAAIEAGMQSIVVVRPGNSPLTEENKQTFKIIHEFTELDL